MEIKRGDPAFTSTGFSNWKDGTISLRKHKDSACHKEVLQMVVVLPASCADIGEMLSKEHADQKRDNRRCLLKVLSNIRFLARQGIALCVDGDEKDSIFIKLLKLRGLADPRVEPWLQVRLTSMSHMMCRMSC